MVKIFTLCLPVLPMTSALSAASIPVRPPSSTFNNVVGIEKSPKTVDNNDVVAPMTAEPWRIALDIGREPLASMPFDWARSGCRMPLVIPCDIRSDQLMLPRSDTVSFTGPNGAVVSKVEGGTWEWNPKTKQFQAEFTFPEYMERRDVWIDADTTITLEGRIYTQSELDQLDAEFYQAREELWEIGGELNEIAKQQEGPKKWNEETKKWEKRTDGIPSIFSQVQKRMQYFGAQNKQRHKANQRPSANDISERGSFPGMDDGIYIQKQGIIKKGNVVMGKWSAEPMIQ